MEADEASHDGTLNRTRFVFWPECEKYNLNRGKSLGMNVNSLGATTANIKWNISTFKLKF